MIRLLWLSLALALAAPGEAAAGPEEEAAELAERGRQLFDAGEYAESLKRYRAAYALHAHPTYLFNQGRAASKLGDCEQALEAYRSYVEAPELTTEAAIEYARGEIERLEAECGEPVIVPDEPEKPEPVAEPEKPDPPDVVIAPPPKPEPSARRPWQIATVAGAAVTAGLFGYWAFEANRLGAFGGDGHYTEKVLEANGRAEPGPITGDDICDNPQVSQPGYEEVAGACSDGKSAETRATITFVAMLGAGAATAVFAYYGFVRPEPEAETISVGPGPGDIGIAAALRF